MNTISLTKGQKTIVDKEDYYKFNKLKWIAGYDPHTKSFRAQRGVHVLGSGKKGKTLTIFLHREIMTATKGQIVDHINHDTLDNRKSNLRICTIGQNNFNRKGINSKNTSGYRGVTWNIKSNKWQAQLQYKGKQISLGFYANKNLAVNAAEKGRIKYYGQFKGEYK